MKKITIFLLGLVFFNLNVMAQNEGTTNVQEKFHHHTVVVGADIAWIGNNGVSPACSAGPNVGYMFEWTDYKSKVYISAGALVNYSSSKTFDNAGIKVPIMAGFTFGNRKINVSPYAGLGFRFHLWGEQYAVEKEGKYPDAQMFEKKDVEVADKNKWATFYPYFMAGAKMSITRFEIFARYEFTLGYGDGSYGHGISTGVGIHF